MHIVKKYLSVYFFSNGIKVALLLMIMFLRNGKFLELVLALHCLLISLLKFKISPIFSNIYKIIVNIVIVKDTVN